MVERKRILVLTLSFGSGHVRAAEAVASEVTAQDREANVRLTDALAASRLLFRAAYVAPYWLMLRRAPRVWRWYFARRNRSSKPETAPEWAFARGCPQVFAEIARWRPHVVVACEVAACEMAAAARRRALTDAKLVCVITDHEAEPAWIRPEADVYCVADARVAESLVKWGARRERVRVCGIPVGREFAPQSELAAETAATRARFGLREGVPLVLLMGGGMGPTRMDEVAARLCRAHVPLDVVAVAGQDRRALRGLERVRDEHAARAPSPVTLQAHGWVDEIAPLMRAASLLVTKPGGLSTTEAAACALPCVLFDAIPGPEQANARRVVESGAGVETRGARATAEAALSLVADEPRRLSMSACASRLAQPEAAATVARLTLEAARGNATGDAQPQPDGLHAQSGHVQFQSNDLKRRTA